MCLAVHALVVSLEDPGFALVEVDQVRHRVCVDLVPHVQPGSYVLVHAGFAIAVVDEEEALQTLALFREMKALGEAPRSP